MSGKQAKILSDANIDDLLLFAETTRQPARNKVMVLLSAKAGLRAGEIAHLTWEMVTDPPSPRVGGLLPQALVSGLQHLEVERIACD